MRHQTDQANRHFSEQSGQPHIPVDMIQSIEGLSRVLWYLDAMRGRILCRMHSQLRPDTSLCWRVVETQEILPLPAALPGLLLTKAGWKSFSTVPSLRFHPIARGFPIY
ncbi:MbcA/ParS/Xre antitoxin family protein [Oceanobacter antarcticus]|uniref:MbcA/ParS/Xre antitoxin family protein n=1 Tax=Oceanobacter antarcticus TaxID=3133425 RepID=UPI003A10239D